MYIDESIKMKEIKKIFCDNKFLRNPLSIKKITEKLGGEEKERVEAMRSIVCRMQEGEDLDFMFNEVIKVIDTRCVELKRLTNIFLKKYTKDNPVRQLLCVNTVLKDLGDKSQGIRDAALHTVGFLGDEVVLGNYTRQLKRLECEGVLDAIGRIVSRMDSSIVGEFREIIRGFIFSEDSRLSIKALACCINDPVQESEVLDLLRRKNDYTSLYFLVKMIYINRLEVDLNFLMKCLRMDYLPLFFFTSSILLSRDVKHRQLVYEASLLMTTRSPEEYYHILLFQEPLLDFVDYDNASYVVHEDDPIYIKRQKVKMLFHRLDDSSMSEIRRLSSDTSLLETILENAIKRNFEIPLKGQYPLEILCRNYPLPSSYSLKKDLVYYRDIQDVPKFLFLAGNLCDEKPQVFEEIKKMQKPEVAYDILKFLLTFFRRKILSLEELVEEIKSLRRNPSFRKKAKAILEIVNSKGPYALMDFAETKPLSEPPKRGVKLDLTQEKGEGGEMQKEDTLHNQMHKNEGEMHKNELSLHKNESTLHKDILSCKPYVDKSLKNCLFSNEWLRSTTASSSGDVLVDTRHLKGTLLLLPDSVSLEIDILEKPQKILFGFENLKELILKKEETVTLLPLSPSLLNKSLRLVISNSVFEILLDPKRLMSPHECSLMDFEESFKLISSYKIVEKFNPESIYSLNDTSFSFKILGHVVYGKAFCDQVVLKGEREILEIFK